MTTIIKAKLKKSDDQTKYDKYHRILYYIKIKILQKNQHSKIHDDNAIISCIKYM